MLDQIEHAFKTFYETLAVFFLFAVFVALAKLIWWLV